MRIKSVLRSYDLLGRYGGEEFLVVAPNCTFDDAVSIAERVRACVASQELNLGRLKIGVTVSIGVTGVRDVIPELSSLLRAADRALYAAKRNGRNRVDVHAQHETTQ